MLRPETRDGRGSWNLPCLFCFHELKFNWPRQGERVGREKLLNMLYKLIFKDRLPFAFSLLSIAVLFFFNMKFSFMCSIDIDWIQFLKESFSAIAGSYIAGYLFYIFSVLYPKSKQLPPIFKVMKQQILFAKSQVMDLSYNVCGKYEINNNNLFKSMLISRKIGDSIEVNNNNCRLVLQTMNNILLLMQYPMSKSELLYKEDIDNLSEVTIIVSWTIARIMDVKPDSMLFEEKDFQKFYDGIVKLYNLLECTYNHLEKFQ